MKKYLLKYFNPTINERVYAKSVDENGCTYILVSKQEDAERFYGKDAIKQIERRIKLDAKKLYGYSEYTIEEIEEEPNWYFELIYAISQYDNIYKSVKKGFLILMTETDKQKIITEHKKYNYKNPEVITVHDLQNLGVEILEKYYYWRKENYKGKPKQY